MSQRESGYERKERDLYETPAWVTEALRPHLYEGVFHVWEPACGSGKMVRALEAFGLTVHGTDIETGADFLERGAEPIAYEAIVTNPPYALAQKFIEHALNQPVSVVAMLLRTDYDHAKSRQHLFQDQRFAKKVVLTKRIKWFEDSKGQPSFNHAWFIWETAHRGPPTLAYGPRASSDGGGESRPALSSTLAPQASAVADVVVHPAGVAPGPSGAPPTLEKNSPAVNSELIQ